jgi:hypothetical protein
VARVPGRRKARTTVSSGRGATAGIAQVEAQHRRGETANKDMDVRHALCMARRILGGRFWPGTRIALPREEAFRRWYFRMRRIIHSMKLLSSP